MPKRHPDRSRARLPPARMIDPRGHRFGAGLSAILLVGRVRRQAGSRGVVLALLSIGTSAAFGLKCSIYGAIWRRIVRIAQLGKTEPEHEYPPRFAQTLGSIALILSLLAFARGLGDARLGCFALAVAGAADAPRGDRLLPRLPAVLPALVAAVGRDVALDARPRDEAEDAFGGRSRRAEGGRSYGSIGSAERYGPVAITSPSSNGWSGRTIRYRWWTSVAPAESIALTGQYFVADSSIAAPDRLAVDATTRRPRGRGRSGEDLRVLVALLGPRVDHVAVHALALLERDRDDVHRRAGGRATTSTLSSRPEAPVADRRRRRTAGRCPVSASKCMPCRDRRRSAVLIGHAVSRPASVARAGSDRNCSRYSRAYRPPRARQLGVRAAFDDPAALVDEDPVGAQDRRQAVGDRDRRAALHESLEGGLDEPLGDGVERRGRLVEDEDPRILEQHPGDGDALLLAARQLVAALADDRVVALGQLGDRGRGWPRRARRRLELRVGRFGLRVEQVRRGSTRGTGTSPGSRPR